jgi:ketosteroid isomerase-like protein
MGPFFVPVYLLALPLASDMDIVRAVFDAFAQRDIARVEQVISEDMEFHAVTAEVAGRDGPYRGHAGMELYFADVDEIWDEINLTPIDFEQVGDVVLVTGRVWARGGGRVVDSSTGWLFEVRDGRIARARVFESAAEAAAAAKTGLEG